MKPWETLGPDPEFQTILETVSSGHTPDGTAISFGDIDEMLNAYRAKYIITDEEYRWLKHQRTFKKG